MGLLDGLFNLSPEQSRGLMAASAKMLELSGPSRMPRSLGQIVGAAYGTYNDATAEEQQRAELKQQRELQQRLLNWKIKDAEADFTHQQGVRERDGRIAGKIKKLYSNDEPGLGGGLPGAMPDGLSSLLGLGGQSSLGGVGALLGPAVQGLLGNSHGAADLPSEQPGGPKLSDFNTSYNGTPYSHAEAQAAVTAAGGVDDPDKLNQIMGMARQGIPAAQASQLLSGGGGRPSQGVPGVPGAQGGASSGIDPFKLGLPPAVALSIMQGGRGRQSRTQQAADRMMQEAEIYASEGDFENADKRFKSAAGLMPQVDRIEIATDPSTQQPVRVITFKDGSEQVSAFGAKRDMVEMNLGGVTEWVDRNRVQNGQTFKRTMTPGEVASTGIQRERLRYERERDGRPVYNADAGGFIIPPSRSNPNGGVIPLAGSAARGPKMTEDQAKATGWLVQAENAWKNMQAVAFDPEGKITDAARPGRAEAMATAVPFGMGEAAANSLRSADRQKFIQGASSLSESLLRAATGAGVTQDEAVQKVRELTPVWGDTNEVINQKMESIPLYLDSLRVRAGPGAGQAANVIAQGEQRRAAAGKYSITLPDGRTFNFPDAKSLANFKLTTGLK